MRWDGHGDGTVVGVYRRPHVSDRYFIYFCFDDLFLQGPGGHIMIVAGDRFSLFRRGASKDDGKAVVGK